MTTAIAAYPTWGLLNRRIVEAIAPLDDQQWAQGISPDRGGSADSPGPERWPLWAVVGHLAYQRVFWLCDFAGEPGAATTPFTNAAWSCPGDEDLVNVLNAGQLTTALSATFAIVERVLDTWPLDSLEEVIDHSDLEEGWRHSRGFVLDRVHAHDLWHAAEASEILTALGLPPIDPWG